MNKKIYVKGENKSEKSFFVKFQDILYVVYFCLVTCKTEILKFLLDVIIASKEYLPLVSGIAILSSQFTKYFDHVLFEKRTGISMP